MTPNQALKLTCTRASGMLLLSWVLLPPAT